MSIFIDVDQLETSFVWYDNAIFIRFVYHSLVRRSRHFWLHFKQNNNLFGLRERRRWIYLLRGTCSKRNLCFFGSILLYIFIPYTTMFFKCYIMKIWFFFKVIPVIFFFSCFIQILYYIGVMQWVVMKFGWALQCIMGTTICESLNCVSNTFIGMVISFTEI